MTRETRVYEQHDGTKRVFEIYQNHRYRYRSRSAAVCVRCGIKRRARRPRGRRTAIYQYKYCGVWHDEKPVCSLDKGTV